MIKLPTQEYIDSMDSQTIGFYYEQLFQDYFDRHEVYCVNATVQEDMYGGLDKYVMFYPNIISSVQIKAPKKLQRSDPHVQYELIWIEYQNVRGNKGSLFRGADYFAFGDLEKFTFYKRKDLVQFIETYVNKETLTNPCSNPLEAINGTFYKRRNRDDRVTLIPISKFKNLPNFTVMLNA